MDFKPLGHFQTLFFLFGFGLVWVKSTKIISGRPWKKCGGCDKDYAERIWVYQTNTFLMNIVVLVWRNLKNHRPSV